MKVYYVEQNLDALLFVRKNFAKTVVKNQNYGKFMKKRINFQNFVPFSNLMTRLNIYFKNCLSLEHLKLENNLIK